MADKDILAAEHIEITSATAGDLQGVLALYRELRPNDPVMLDAKAEEVWQAMTKDANCDIIVAKVTQQIASSCSLTLNTSLANAGKPFAMIEHVITAKEHRRKGLSKKVLEHAIALAWQKGCCKIMLLSGAQLTGAHALYESVGFKAGIERGFVLKPDLASA